MLEIDYVEQVQNGLKERMHEIIWVEDNLYKID
jgi:hypothetical protein